jgi:SAM-dependent methyltransferase
MLDVGCGLGRQSAEMIHRGYRVVGTDISSGLLSYAAAAAVPVAAADALRLPFADETFDTVYTIGVLHHLGGPPEQQAACQEIARVLRPGGRFLIHESNPRNPLFRFYVGYVFPLLKTIDEGTECWIDPRDLNRMSRFNLLGVQYFTFLPDFIPRAFLRPLLGLQRMLEASPLRPYSVHYFGELQKVFRSPPGGTTSSLKDGLVENGTRGEQAPSLRGIPG